jgi:uncharacterized protein YbcV (DUF1398 family)
MEGSMDEIIDEAIKQVAAGTLDFPGYVKLLATAGIDCYTVDLSNHKMTYYAGTKTFSRKFLGKDLDIASRFNENIIRDAIRCAQKKEISYLGFLEELAVGGVESYEASFKLKNVTYRGRRKSYVEQFAPVV